MRKKNKYSKEQFQKGKILENSSKMKKLQEKSNTFLE